MPDTDLVRLTPKGAYLLYRDMVEREGMNIARALAQQALRHQTVAVGLCVGCGEPRDRCLCDLFERLDA